ncbi:MAG: hypothetical protein U1E45_02340 [Geminicoccaceae bacterium]
MAALEEAGPLVGEAVVAEALADLQAGDSHKAEAIFEAVIEGETAVGNGTGAATAAKHLAAVASRRSPVAARDGYARATVLDPDDIDAWMFLAEAQGRLAEPDAALAAFEGARAAGERRGIPEVAAVADVHAARLLLAEERYDEAGTTARRGVSVLREAVDADPANLDRQRDLAIGLSALGDAMMAQRTPDEAAAAYREVVSIDRRLFLIDRANLLLAADLAEACLDLASALRSCRDVEAAEAAETDARGVLDGMGSAPADEGRRVAICWGRLGRLRMASDDFDGAQHAVDSSRLMFERLAEARPGDLSAQRDLAIAWNRLTELHRAQGDMDEAVRALVSEVDIRARLAAGRPQNPRLQRELTTSCVELGDVRWRQGDLAGALGAFDDAAAISRKLAGGEYDLVLCLRRIAEVRTEQDDMGGAEANYAEILKIAGAAAAEEPDNADWRREIAVARSALGDVLRAKGDLVAALRAREDAHEDFEALAADSGDGRAIDDLAASWNKVGSARRDLGDLDGARRAFAAHLDLRRRMATERPDDPRLQRTLLVAQVKLADTSTAMGQPGVAAEIYVDALSLADDLAATGRLSPDDAWIPDDIRGRLAELGSESDPLTAKLH